MVPLVLAWLFLLGRRPGERERTGALLGFAWNVSALLAVNLLAIRWGWWRFDARGGTFWEIPVDLWLGWAVLWGVVLPWSRLPVWVAVPLALWLDLGLMPAAHPVVRLDRQTWLQGEAVALGIALIPGLLLAHWTRRRVHLRTRVFLQMAAFAGLVGWILPSVVLEQTGGSWRDGILLDPDWGPIVGQGMFVVLLPGLAAVFELRDRGEGTPVPWDPPRRLVRTGPYAYLRHPMQASILGGLTLLGAALGNAWLVAAAVSAAAFLLGLASWHEGEALTERYGDEYRRYRAEVPGFLPRYRPWTGGAPARLYVARGCSSCEAVGAWISRRSPRGLQICWAQQHPRRDLWRLTYESDDEVIECEGVAALGRALSHLSLPWAMLGFGLTLPVVRPGVQMLADALGAGPRRVQRLPEGKTEIPFIP